MSRWYRAYEGTVTDPKFGEAAILANTQRCVTVTCWHALLESAACCRNSGKYDTNTVRLSAALQVPVDTIAAVLKSFEEIGLIENGSIKAWKSRQFESDSSTSRSRKYRELQRNATATLQQQDATPHRQSTETETEDKKDIVRKRTIVAYPPEFETFWKAYPHRIGKGEAFRAWPKAFPSTPFEILLLAVDRYVATKPAHQDWCHPATWLNQQRWLDEPAAPTEGKAHGQASKSTVAAADRLVEKVRGFIDDASRPIRPVLALTGK